MLAISSFARRIGIMNPSTNHNRPRRLFTNVNFILFWCAYGVSATGDHLSEMALLKTQDALNPNVDITRLTAGMTFTFFLPFFCLHRLRGHWRIEFRGED